ncbi:MAG: hypothetical protein LBE22_05540 [Azoarcus sp.]|jgi:starvation-inducible outer membrane lipoprotein|nr:hypothetical protein [Azoarcus sp.]
MKYFWITLTCFAVLSGCKTTQQASQNDMDARPEAATSTTARQGGQKVGQEGSPAVRGGKIVGTPASKSKFKNLRLGMSRYVIEKQLGMPDDIQHNVTGKAFAPFYYGTDRVRYTAYYKGSGTLIYSGTSSDKLIEIHHNASESGDRTLR